ncbi:hypothetical protein AXG93_2318s1350 [Marchantia polymorpha subsp. ruderalis]|uniref:Uncharacterized protein n=1 Tax=Marchantia polymorpha subsp. ruderalis TaxID=1480154 RepID=A0A176VN92_MARPO|nr:hypothetical protein AXG93_2318s1350 [Marchantia polymorpha subsp. ruderalis]
MVQEWHKIRPPDVETLRGIPAIWTKCSGGLDADPSVFADNLHGDMAGRICGARDGRKAYSLGTHSMRDYTPPHQRNSYEDEIGEEQGGDTEVENSSQGRRTSRQPLVYTPSVDLDCGEGPLIEEPKSAGLSVADILGKQMVPLLRYLDMKMTKYAKPAIAGSYVKFVCGRTRTKVVASVEVAERVSSWISEFATVKATLQARKKRLRQSELQCAELRRSLIVEKYLRATSELECMSFCVDIGNARKATIDLQDKLEASRVVAFNEESGRVDELTADLEKHDQLHDAELALKAKELQDC